MIRSILNWRAALALIAIIIIASSVFYSQYLARKIAKEERVRVEQWVAAEKLLMTDTTGISTPLVTSLITENKTIPIIVTNEKGHVVLTANLDSIKLAADSNYALNQLQLFKQQNEPIENANPINPNQKDFIYYGHTRLLNEVQYYPLLQLLVVALFIIIAIVSIAARNKATQNQLWAGMAKETAHQLGTPITSLEGWVEMLKDNPANDAITTELQKDVNRLKLVSDRFGKIGSTPQLEPQHLVAQVNSMVEYIRKRASGKVQLVFDHSQAGDPVLPLSAPLFDWVIENLLKNALDAIEGKGSINVLLKENEQTVFIDVTDTGKGITGTNINNVFKPGFTTKKRGWGLGLSLSKRIIEQFHKGEIFVKHSEPGKGTTFRIILKK